MQYVVWVGDSQLRYQYMAGSFESNGLSLYFLEQTDDIDFILDDMKPIALIIDEFSYSEELPSFCNRDLSIKKFVLRDEKASQSSVRLINENQSDLLIVLGHELSFKSNMQLIARITGKNSDCSDSIN
jgi:hypothetical protein